MNAHAGESLPASSLLVEPSQAGRRLDAVLAEVLAEQGVSRSKVRVFLDDGLVSVDGHVMRKPSFKLGEGMELSWVLPQLVSPVQAKAGSLELLYQDAHLVVLNKPVGLTVHPAPSVTDDTLVHRLLAHFPQLAEQGGERPGIVHRLDKDTSGLIVVALREGVRLELCRVFAERNIHKTYLALVTGKPKKAQGLINEPIDRSPTHKTKMAVVKGGRESSTGYRVVWSAPDGSCSLVECELFTGRTHQIRVHMSHLGHPLVGDRIYGYRPWPTWPRALARLAGRQMLHAWKLSFTHPVTSEALDFTLPLPRDFQRLLWALPLPLMRVGLTGLPGCGKSAVLAELEALGFATFNADASVARFYGPGGDATHVLRGRFGDRFVPSEGGGVDKPALFAAMRASPALRKEIESLVHPLVRHELESFWLANKGKRQAFAEIPLLVEAGFADVVDVAVFVDCEPELRRQRLSARSGLDAEAMADLESWQASSASKQAACRYTLTNSETREALRDEIRGLLAFLRTLRIKDRHKRLAVLTKAGYLGAGLTRPDQV